MTPSVDLLKQTNHTRPLIYMRGMNAKDLVSVVDFVYYGEVNIYQEDLHEFLKGNQRIEAHKVILSASSDSFRDLLKQTNHSHPLIYMRGMKAKDLVSVVDFVYYGEVNIYQDLHDFLDIAGELKLR